VALHTSRVSFNDISTQNTPFSNLNWHYEQVSQIGPSGLTIVQMFLEMKLRKLAQSYVLLPIGKMQEISHIV
jgi:hypothetical protein